MLPPAKIEPFESPFAGMAGRGQISRIGARPQDDYERQLEELQTSRGPAIEAYRQHLEALPNREDYKPGWMTRIAAALSGASAGFKDPSSGVATARDVNEGNYASAVRDYANKGMGLKERAGMEQEELDSKIRALGARQTNILKERELDIDENRYRSEADARDMTAESGRITALATQTRANAYAADLASGEYRATPTMGGILMINSKDPSKSHMVDAQTVVAHQAMSGRIGANAAASNAASNAARVPIAQQEANTNEQAMHDRRNAEFNKLLDPEKPLLPNQQDDAGNMVIEEFAADPLYSSFLEPVEAANGAKYHKIKMAPDPRTASQEELDDYADFVEAYNERITSILKGKPQRPGGR